MSLKKHFIDDIQNLIFNRMTTPSCDICGFNWSFARASVMDIEAERTFTISICYSCVEKVIMIRKKNLFCYDVKLIEKFQE